MDPAQRGRNYVGDARPIGSGTSEILEVTQLLEAAGIPSCIVGVKALRYFGAGRVDEEWDVCVQDEQLDAARCLFETPPLNTRFERVAPPLPDLQSLRHQCPTFKLKGVIFYFLLAPASDTFCDPRPEFCERSHMGIPYPQDLYFARSLLVRQLLADLADFVDAQDSRLEWGEKHLNLAELQAEGVEYARRKNEKLAADSVACSLLSVDPNFAGDWKSIVESKGARIEPEKHGRYTTRWRSRARPYDPRKPDPRDRFPMRDYV